MEKVTDKKNSYKSFKDLTEYELDTLLFYEEFCSKIMGKYITSFDSKYIKEKYGNCTFPPFVLNMMKTIREQEY